MSTTSTVIAVALFFAHLGLIAWMVDRDTSHLENELGKMEKSLAENGAVLERMSRRVEAIKSISEMLVDDVTGGTRSERIVIDKIFRNHHSVDAVGSLGDCGPLDTCGGGGGQGSTDPNKFMWAIRPPSKFHNN